jgi:hypothetical protein
MKFEILPAGASFVIPGGHDAWDEDEEEDGSCVCPFPFALVSGPEAEAVAEEISRTHAGATPVILGSLWDAAGLLEHRANYIAHTKSGESTILARAARMNADTWVAERLEALEEDSEGGEALPSSGGWPRHVQPAQELCCIWESNWKPGARTPYDPVVIGLLPAADSAEALAYLRFGGRNDCPEPEIHAAFARRWQEAYGARLAAVTSEVLEFRVSRPVSSREDALRLAKEQFLYCFDIVEQGAGTIERLAAERLGGTAWYFWWD